MKQFGILAAAAAMAGLEIFPSVFGDAVPSGGPSAMTPALEPPVLFRSDAALISPAPPEAEKEVDEISSEEEVDDVSDEEEDDESSDEGESDEDPSEEEGDEVSLGFTKRDDGPFGNGTLAKRGYCKPRPKPKPRTCPRKGHKLSSGSVCKKYKRCRKFKARDGCNTCKCVKGRAQCTKKRCPKPRPKPKPRTCPRKGHKLSNGSVCRKYMGCRQFKARDGCNTCRCVKGRAQCTKKRCPKPTPKPKTKWCYYNKGAWHCRPRTPRCKLVL